MKITISNLLVLNDSIILAGKEESTVFIQTWGWIKETIHVHDFEFGVILSLTEQKFVTSSRQLKEGLRKESVDFFDPKNGKWNYLDD